MKKRLILDIYSSKNTVFTIKDIALIWGESNTGLVKTRIYRYVKAGKLYRIRKGIYAKNKKYDKLEMATRIFTPSYVSFETVLGQSGVTFQYYGQIFVASYLNREITCDGQTYSFKKIKNPILFNRTGIEAENNYYIASPERALLDVIYLCKDYHFDNLSTINWDKIYEILPIYNNKRMEKKIKRYQKATEQGLN
jgi:predicted transcriptional regulator of viral defense system